MAGQYEFAARDSLFSDISETLCHKVTDSVRRNESACAVPENIIFAVAGFDAPQMNFTLLPVILGHTPAGTSSRTVLHFAQGVQSGLESLTLAMRRRIWTSMARLSHLNTASP